MEKKHTFVQKLSEILERNKAITHKEVLAIQKEFSDSEKEQFDDFLVEEGLVESSELLRALGQYYQVPSFDVVGYFFDHDLLTKFSKGFLLREAVLPVELDGNILSVVASDPSKEGLESKLREYVSYDIVFMVGLRRDICDTIKEFYDLSPSEAEEDQDTREERQLESEAEIIEDSGRPIIGDEED